MSRTLTDLSQLSKAMIRAAPKVDEAKPESSEPKPHEGGEDVLAYFSRPAADAKRAQKTPARAPAADGTDARMAALERDAAALRAQLRDSEAARSDAEAKCADLAREQETLADALSVARKEVERLKGECGRLQGEVRKTAQTAPDAVDAKAEPSQSVVPTAERPSHGVLAPPAAFTEMFPGEVREMALTALSEARDAARQSSRDRRAAVLDAVLAANRPTGELERRRAELKQAMKDCGYYTDPHALESLGFKLISGRSHWKIEYAGIRMPVSKTPSDYRAGSNTASVLANRCF